MPITNNLLESHLIRLRAVEPVDIDFILKMENNPEIWKVSNTLVPFSRFQIEQYAIGLQHDIYAEKQLRLMIELKVEAGSPVTIGMVDLFDFDPHHLRAGIGIMIIEEDQGKGYASETLDIFIGYCFKILEIHQLYCSITLDNTKSLNLFRKHGFVSCGIRKEWLFQQGIWTDEEMFQLINR